MAETFFYADMLEQAAMKVRSGQGPVNAAVGFDLGPRRRWLRRLLGW
jgi:hypothetical protein